MKKNRAKLQPRLLYLAVFLLFIVALNAYKTEWFGDTWDASQQVVTMKNLAPKQSLSVKVEPLPTHKNTAERLDKTMPSATARLPNDKNTALKTTALPTKAAQVTSTTMMPTFAQQNDAFQAVFAAWNIDYDPKNDGEACVFAEKHQLQCLRQRQSIAQMRNLNRPAVLTLSDASGATAFVAINALSGTHAYLAPLDGSEANDTAIPLPSLALQSHNDFTILWQTPKAYKGPVRPGHQGKLVQQLAEKCTQVLQQQWIGAPRLLYDATLKEQVKIFQRNQGLSPDGVAGPITWIHLNSLTNQGFPSLTYTPAKLKATNQGEG
jgi:general secretion pathway protein A